VLFTNIIRVIRSRRVRCSANGEMRNAYKILVGKPERRRPFRKPRHRWEDNIKMDLREIGFGDVDCIHLAQDGEHGNELLGSIKCGVFLD
jgi:hypothetical protein